MKIPELPLEMLYTIMINLPLQEILLKCHTSKDYDKICHDEFFWRAHAEKHMTVKQRKEKPSKMDWKGFVIMNYLYGLPVNEIEKLAKRSYIIEEFLSDPDFWIYYIKHKFPHMIKILYSPSVKKSSFPQFQTPRISIIIDMLENDPYELARIMDAYPNELHSEYIRLKIEEDILNHLRKPVPQKIRVQISNFEKKFDNIIKSLNVNRRREDVLDIWNFMDDMNSWLLQHILLLERL